MAGSASAPHLLRSRGCDPTILFLRGRFRDDGGGEVIDTATLQIIDTLPSGPDPELFVLSPDGKTLYVATRTTIWSPSSTSKARACWPKSRSASSRKAWASAPDDKTMVNTSETTNMAHFIDTEMHEITHNVLDDSRPRFVEFTPDGKQAWVSADQCEVALFMIKLTESGEEYGLKLRPSGGG